MFGEKTLEKMAEDVLDAHENEEVLSETYSIAGSSSRIEGRLEREIVRREGDSNPDIKLESLTGLYGAFGSLMIAGVSEAYTSQQIQSAGLNDALAEVAPEATGLTLAAAGLGLTAKKMYDIHTRKYSNERTDRIKDGLSVHQGVWPDEVELTYDPR